MKRFLALFLIMVMVSGLMPTVALAAPGDFTITTGSITGERGQNVLVPITITNNTSLSLLTVVVNFDSTRLEWQNKGTYTPGTTSTHPWTRGTFINWTSAPGTGDFRADGVRFSFMDMDGIETPSGTLMTLQLRVKDDAPAGDAAITLNVTLIGDANYNMINYNLNNGKVTVPSILYGDVTDDGVVSAADVTRLRQWIAGWDVVINELLADVTGDDDITSADVTRLRQWIAGWNVKLGL